MINIFSVFLIIVSIVSCEFQDRDDMKDEADLSNKILVKSTLRKGTLESNDKRVLIKELSVLMANRNIELSDSIQLEFSDSVETLIYQYSYDELENTSIDTCTENAYMKLLTSLEVDNFVLLDAVMNLVHQSEYKLGKTSTLNQYFYDNKFVFVIVEFLKINSERSERWLRALNAYCYGNPRFDFYEDQLFDVFNCCNDCDALEKYDAIDDSVLSGKK